MPQVTGKNGRRGGGCGDRNKGGGPCGMPPLEGSDRCFAHSADRGRERALARKKGGRNRRSAGRVAAPTERPSLRDVASIQTELEAAVFDTQQMENSSQRNRTIGYLLGTALKAMEVGEVEDRLAALEALVGRAGPRLA